MTSNRHTEPGASEAHRARPWPVWARVTAGVLLAAALLVPLIVWRERIGWLLTHRDEVAASIGALGPVAPLVLILFMIAQTLVAPIPGQVLNYAAGYLFGLWGGLALSWAGMLAGSTLAMALARVAGRPLVARLVGNRMMARLDRVGSGQGLRFFVLAFLIPGLPDDLLCFAAGLTRLPLRILVAATAVARIPGLVGSVWLGAYSERLSWQGWVALGAASLALAIVAWRYSDRLWVRLRGDAVL